MAYSKRIEEAFALAHSLHKDQTRKGSAIPYISHLMAVASIVGEFGGDEDQAIAALLHDAVEDQGGRETLRRIAQTFGDRIAAYVEGCSDAFTDPKPPWQERKEAFIDSMKQAPADLRLIVAADKLHNIRSMTSDLRTLGPPLWERFTKGRQGTLWYHDTIVSVLTKDWDHPLAIELQAALTQLHDADSNCG